MSFQQDLTRAEQVERWVYPILKQRCQSKGYDIVSTAGHPAFRAGGDFALTKPDEDGIPQILYSVDVKEDTSIDTYGNFFVPEYKYTRTEERKAEWGVTACYDYVVFVSRTLIYIVRMDTLQDLMPSAPLRTHYDADCGDTVYGRCIPIERTGAKILAHHSFPQK